VRVRRLAEPAWAHSTTRKTQKRSPPFLLTLASTNGSKLLDTTFGSAAQSSAVAVPPHAGVPFDPQYTDVLLAHLTMHVRKRPSPASAPQGEAEELPAVAPPVQQAPSPAPSAGGPFGGGAQSQPLFSPVCGQPLPASQRMSFGAPPALTAEPTPAAVRPSTSPAVASMLRPGFLSLGRTIAGGISPALAVERSGGGPFGASPVPAFGAPRDPVPMDVSATAAAAAINAAAAAPPSASQPSSVPGIAAPASQREGMYVASQQGQPLSMPDPSVDILPSHARTTHSLGGATQALGEASSAHTADAGATQLVLDEEPQMPVASAMLEGPGATQLVGTEPVPESQARGGMPSRRETSSPEDGEAIYHPPFMVVPPAVDLWSDSQLVSQPPPAQQQHAPPVLAAVPEEPAEVPAGDEVQPVEPPVHAPMPEEPAEVPADEEMHPVEPELPPADAGAADLEAEVLPASVGPHAAPSPAPEAAPADMTVVEAHAEPQASDSDVTRDEPPGGGTALVDDASGGVSPPMAVPEEAATAVEPSPVAVASQPAPEAVAAAASPEAATGGEAAAAPSQPVGEMLSPPAVVPPADVAVEAPQVEAGDADAYDSDVTVDESPRAAAESEPPAAAEPGPEAEPVAEEPSPAALFSPPVDQPLQLRDSTAGHDTASPPIHSVPIEAAEPEVAPEAVPEQEVALPASADAAAAPVVDDVEAAAPAGGVGTSSQLHVASMFNSTQVPVDSQMQAGAWDNVGAFYDHTQLPVGGTPPPPAAAPPAPLFTGGGAAGETQLAVGDLEDFMARVSKEASDEPAPQPAPGDGGTGRRKGVTPRRRGAPAVAFENAEVPPAAAPIGCETQVAADTVADMMTHAQNEAPVAATGRAGRKSKASAAAAPTPAKEAAARTAPCLLYTSDAADDYS
jgi:hypothetical protein